MPHHHYGLPPRPQRTHRPPVPSPRRRKSLHLFVVLLLMLLLLSDGLGNWATIIPTAYAASLANAAYAAGRPGSGPASMTLRQFLKQGPASQVGRGPFVFPRTPPHMPFSAKEQMTDYSHLPPSSEPVTMQPLHQTLDATFLKGGAGSRLLDLVGSDHRLEVQVPPGALDLSQARTASGATVSGSVVLSISEIHGHFIGGVNLLGSYQFQLTDVQGRTIQGVRLHSPLTFIYHYQSTELIALNLNPDALVMTWPDLTYVARQAHQPIANLTIVLHNDPKAHTLTGQSLVIGNGHFDMGGGDPDNQSPIKPHLASEQGNSGQLAYSYPLVVAPGPLGTTPSLALNYSSSNSNERHSRTAPTDNVGEGWSLTLGSISADVYPGSSAGVGTWYFISGVDNVSDRLVPDSSGTSFLTEHISQLRVRQVTSGFGQPCFNVWDTSGNYYQFGCTTDSLQYRTDSTGRHNYRWDLNRVTAANEGPGTANRNINISYLQDIATAHGYTSVRDAVMKQITYGGSTLAGTVDFFYRAPFNSSPWATAYGTNYNCSNPPVNTTLRCDDPLDFPGALNAPSVFSTFSLQTIKTYVGDDSTNSHLDYSYSLSYQDTPFSQCWDDYTQAQEYCVGNHLLTSVTPTVYQNGTAHQLKGLALGYTSPLQDGYYDSTHTIQNGQQQYHIQTYWQYLNSYYDSSNGVGGSAAYQLAYNNTHGTPYDSSSGDDRHDALYCSTHSDCTGTFAWPEDRAWSVQVVIWLKTSGKDSSASGLSQATTTYHYQLAITGHSCPADSKGDVDCVGDNWTPKGNTGNTDNDWQDYFHSEFRGFNVVYVTSPSGDVTADTYASTEGWATYEGNSGNLTAGNLYEEDVYNGSNTSGVLLSKTVNTYAGNNNTPNPCNGNYSGVYTPCEVMVTSSRTTQYEGSGSGNVNAPWIQHDYTYDDYNGGGLATGYHNTLQEVVSSSNAPTVTLKWTYTPTDTTVNNWVYYNVHKITHSEVDDANNHVWQCQDTAYDEGVASGVPSPAAGWPTTQKTYSDCTNPGGTAITTYTGYDSNGNPVAAVDGLATSNSGLYSSNGCTLSTAPAYFTASSNWGSGRYTGCRVYDSYGTQPINTINALGQQSSIGYDYTQGSLLTSVTDINNQTTTTSYSYDSNGNVTSGVKSPLETGNYTKQSSRISNCTSSSTLPCFEIDSVLAQYASAVTRTYYDSLGRAVETRSKATDPSLDLVTFTVYDDSAHSVFQSVPFEVQSTLNNGGWVDPNGVVDYQGVAPGGTATFYDALTRPTGVRDPLYGSGQEPGISCPGLQGTWTSCTFYGLGSPHGDSATYFYGAALDANNHAAVSFGDTLGRLRYAQLYSGTGLSSISTNITKVKATQYNAINKPVSVTTTDLVPQTGQSITSVAISETYDDTGRILTVSDPDRGNHTYTYDGDGHMLTDVSGSRTIGYNYDLLGRVGCIEDAVPTINATGACTSGANPFVQNTYDTSVLGGNDYPKGHLTQSIATNYFPGPDYSQGKVTQQMQYDQRGRMVNQHLLVSASGGSLSFPSFPTYQEAISYNDADQVTTTTTSTNPSGLGYTTTQVYDSTTGALTGLSNNGTATANLATQTSNARGLVDTLNFQTTTGSALLQEQFGYDANLRPTSATAAWQSGSGSGGTVMSQTRFYDMVGNVTSLSTTLATVPGTNGSGGSETQNFCYDEQNRLVWAGNSGTQPGAGNGTCGTGTLANSISGAGYHNTEVYTNLDQLWQGSLNGGNATQQYLYCDSSHPHQLTGVYAAGSTCANKGTANYTSSYDAWGNVTSRTYSGTTATLTYDGLDHMVRWNDSSGNEEWTMYDASGQRVLLRSLNAGTTTYTIYAFGLEDHVYNGSGASQGNKYYYTLGGRLIGELTNSSTIFFLTDALGSVLTSFTATAGSAVIQGNQVYGPYGKNRYTKGTIGTTRGFTGQYGDTLTGLDYYVARYYDPVAGVFLSADTVQGNMQGSNPYGYVEGNPETKSDPTGHGPFDPDPPEVIGLLGALSILGPPGIGVAILVAGVIIIMDAPPARNSSPNNPNSPQPVPVPTPNESPTPTPTPSTDTNGARCRTARCYDLVGDEGTSVVWYTQKNNGTPVKHVSTAHTIAQHVNISDAALQQRANAIGSASKFYSLDAAEWATQYALDHMTPAESAQLARLQGNPANAGQRISIQVDTGTAIGYGYRRNNPTPIATSTVTVVIAIDGNGNPFVLTSYPQLPPPPPPPAPTISSGYLARLIQLNMM